MVWSKSSSISISVYHLVFRRRRLGTPCFTRRLAVLFSSVVVIQPDDNEGGDGGEASDQIIQPDTAASKGDAVQGRLSKGVPRQDTA